MDARALTRVVSKLIAEKDLVGAEQLLLEAREEAEADKDTQLLDHLLSELIGLCGICEPPLWARAEALSIEREKLIPSSYNKLQTAMILHYGLGDYVRAFSKLEEAIAQGKAEGDERTVYTSISLLGQICLELRYMDRAVALLSELEQMVASKGSFVVGDETCFLEALHARHLETDRVARLASVLAPVCREAAFRARLQNLLARGE